MANDYRELQVWQTAMVLCEKVYELLKKFPEEERFAMCNQLRRAVVSIPSNIAEGNGRNSRPEYARFLSISRGSVFEVQTQLELAERLGYVKIPPEINLLLSSLSKMLLVMIRKISAR